VGNCSAEKYFGSAWTGCTWSWIEKTGGLFEHGVGPSVSVKCADFHDWLMNIWFFKKRFTVWNCVIIGMYGQNLELISTA
jgi:hypothetical protein